MKTDWGLWLTILFLAALIAYLLIMGCAQPQKNIDPTILTEDTQEKLYKWQEMYSSVIDQFGWLLPVLVLGGVIGVGATFKKPDYGIPLIVGCGYGISVLMAIAFKPEWLAYVGVFGGVGLAVVIVDYRLYKVAFKEVVTGGQTFKIRNRESKSEFNEIQKLSQHKSTQKLVAKVKEKIK